MCKHSVRTRKLNMMTKNKIGFSILGLFLGFLFPHSLLAQSKSVKRGVGWDEKVRPLTIADAERLQDGVSWVYNWGVSANNNLETYNADNGIVFVPQCWNANFDESRLRTWLKTHPNTRYLLGFNEPNFSSQANMTPTEAAKAWPKLEQIAEDFHLKLVAPALNFSGEKVGDRIWSPYEWLDAFLAAYPTAKIDALALHCYMNWYNAQTWFVTEFFYKDLYDPVKTDVYGKYPHLIKYFDTYGKKPMLLTEFCAWEGNKDGYTSTLENQIDQMTQKIQKLEQNDLVEGYAWFMANPQKDVNTYPFNNMFTSSSAGSELSELGKVYVYMSPFDTNKYYTPGETILAKDYIDASMDYTIVRPRPNTEEGSDIPLQVELQESSWTQYQVTATTSGSYNLVLHGKWTEYSKPWIYVDGKKASTNIPITANAWGDVSTTIPLTAGHHLLQVYNAGNDIFLLSSLRLDETTTINSVESESPPQEIHYYDLSGRSVTNASQGITIKKVRTATNQLYTVKVIGR